MHSAIRAIGFKRFNQCEKGESATHSFESNKNQSQRVCTHFTLLIYFNSLKCGKDKDSNPFFTHSIWWIFLLFFFFFFPFRFTSKRMENLCAKIMYTTLICVRCSKMKLKKKKERNKKTVVRESVYVRKQTFAHLKMHSLKFLI